MAPAMRPRGVRDELLAAGAQVCGIAGEWAERPTHARTTLSASAWRSAHRSEHGSARRGRKALNRPRTPGRITDGCTRQQGRRRQSLAEAAAAAAPGRTPAVRCIAPSGSSRASRAVGLRGCRFCGGGGRGRGRGCMVGGGGGGGGTAAAWLHGAAPPPLRPPPLLPLIRHPRRVAMLAAPLLLLLLLLRLAATWPSLPSRPRGARRVGFSGTGAARSAGAAPGGVWPRDSAGARGAGGAEGVLAGDAAAAGQAVRACLNAGFELSPSTWRHATDAHARCASALPVGGA
eukprot:364904-Chlamydomonas_euryale.AAC.22